MNPAGVAGGWLRRSTIPTLGDAPELAEVFLKADKESLNGTLSYRDMAFVAIEWLRQRQWVAE